MAINDDKWKILFDRHNIVDVVGKVGFFDITATQIKTVREPRLMCKMDFKQSVAKPFKDNDLSILAIKNGIYRIAKTTPFFDIDLAKINSAKITDFALPKFIETLDHKNITSESQALDAAVASGMLNKLLSEKSFLTVRGRRYSNNMTLTLPRNGTNEFQTYDITSVQIEVDGGYEGKTKLALIEAKMGTSDNMNMRQLLYPHYHFMTQTKKDLMTYVMFYETGSLFTFIPMKVANNVPTLDYSETVRYRLVEPMKAPSQATPKATLKLLSPGHGAPFPQADDFEKVLFGYFKVAENEGTEEEIFSELAIVPRQYNYYFNAMRWLGIVEKDGRGKPIRLTKFGEDLLNLNESDRLESILELMKLNPVVQHIQETPDQPLANELKERFGLVGISMYPRRRSTIQAWLKYIEDKLGQTELELLV